jgi:hypothetical protein
MGEESFIVYCERPAHGESVLKEGSRESGVGNGGRVFHYLLCAKLMGSLAPGFHPALK